MLEKICKFVVTAAIFAFIGVCILYIYCPAGIPSPDDKKDVKPAWVMPTDTAVSEAETADNAESGGAEYTSVTAKGYVIEMTDGITYVDGIMIANKTYSLPPDYNPGIHKEAALALEKMQAAAAEDGLTLFVISGFRSYKRQEEVYAGWVSSDGAEKADTYSARPGYSDHQTGYTFDLNSCEDSFAYTPEASWIAEHCADFGFIIRYPKGKEAYTGYIYEPWHIRWVGEEKARILTESGLSLEEYYGISSDYGVSPVFA